MKDKGLSYFEDEPHSYRLTGEDGKFAYLKCYHCGEIRRVINPQYVTYYTTKLQQENEERLAGVTPDKPELTSTDLKHLKLGLENYEGNLKNDLLQPFNPDGSRNQEFIRQYGDTVYNDLRPNV